MKSLFHRVKKRYKPQDWSLEGKRMNVKDVLQTSNILKQNFFTCRNTLLGHYI